MRPLTQKSLALAARELAARDEMLAGIHAAYGVPPLWRRDTGFQTLVHIILEQQVSLKSAKAMLVRLEDAIQPFTPLRFLELGDSYLRGLGVTRQKSAYLLHLSDSIVNGDLSFAKLTRMSDEEARLVLTRVKGIGSWSADVYLLMAMRRADIWPAGDLALAVAMQELKGLAKVDLSPGQTKRVAVVLDSRAFSYYDVTTKQWLVPPGDYAILVGRSSADIKLRGNATQR